MPRFVLLYHDCPPHYERPSHWDLMFEVDQRLRTWALPELPGDWGAIRSRTADCYSDCPLVAAVNIVSAEQLADHRLEYLDAQGPLSGDRGQVRRIDGGTYESEAEMPGTWRLSMAGAHWTGSVMLRQTAPIIRQWTLTIRH